MRVEEIRRITSVGTGMIGPDIALACAMAGYSVVMVGRSEASVSRGIARFQKNLGNLVKAGVFDAAEAESIRGHLATSADLADGVREADFIFEGIAENLEAKQGIFAEIEKRCPPHALLASSTSGLSPSDIDARLEDQARMLVMHFWNPPYLVPLVEVVAGAKTSRETVETSMAFLKGLGKEPVLLKKDILGHIGNRLQHALFREALYLVQEGVADPEDIDRVVLNSFGPRYSMIGPMEYMDSVGLDLQVAVHSYLLKTLADAKEPMRVLTEHTGKGELGAKTGKGLYDWHVKSLEETTARQNQRFIDRLKESR